MITKPTDPAVQAVIAYMESINSYIGESVAIQLVDAVRRIDRGEPLFPKGTPEYERYAAELRTELNKWIRGEGEYAL